MLVYLDTSAIGRVLDDYTRASEGSTRQRERGRWAHASRGLLSLAEAGHLRIAISTHGLRELRFAPDGKRLARRVRRIAARRANITLGDLQRAGDLSRRSLSWPDALHAAIAERINADVLLTTDKRMLAGAKSSGTIKTRDLFEWMRNDCPYTIAETRLRRARKRTRKRT